MELGGDSARLRVMETHLLGASKRLFGLVPRGAGAEMIAV